MEPEQKQRLRIIYLLALAGCLIFLITAFPMASLAGPGSSSLDRYFPVVFKSWPLPTPTPGPGRLLITELMYDPSGAEPDGEWIEICNVGERPLDLSSYRVGDEEVPGEQEGMFQFPPGASIAPGQVVLIAYRAANFSATYGFNPDYELRESDPLVPDMLKYTAWAGGNVELVNTGDEVILLDPAEEWSDALSWGNSNMAFDPPIAKVPEGYTLERKPASVDTDSAMDWIGQASPNPGEVDLSLPPTLTPTPQIGGTPVPTGTLHLLVSEVFYDPAASLEPAGEWIELYNAGNAPLSLTGIKLGDEESQGQGEGMLRFPDGTLIQPGQVVLVANQAAVFFAAYGFNPDYEMVNSEIDIPDMLKYGAWASGVVNLNNSGDEIVLMDSTDQWVDAVSWGASTFFFDPAAPDVQEGHSLERYPPGQDTDSALDWRDQANPSPGQVDLTQPTPSPTPTETTIPSPTPVPLLVINEIHADPDANLGDANGDGLVDSTDDEFVEIVNVTGLPVDISGWALGDSLGVRHTFAENTLLLDGCTILVFGGGTPGGSFGGSLVQTASHGTLSLNNTGDAVILYDLDLTPVLSYTYGVEGGDNQSLTRSPDVTGQDPLVKHSSVPASGGALFSPGRRLDASAFPGCSLARKVGYSSLEESQVGDYFGFGVLWNLMKHFR
jgi:hypothetical protein